MAGKAIDAIMFSMVVMSLPPSTALSYSASGVELVGERTAAFLASPFAAAFDPAPLAYPPPLHAYARQPSSGMCRWERFVLDNNGKPVLDQDGKPLKEYVIGSCQYPAY